MREYAAGAKNASETPTIILKKNSSQKEFANPLQKVHRLQLKQLSPRIFLLLYLSMKILEKRVISPKNIMNPGPANKEYFVTVKPGILACIL